MSEARLRGELPCEHHPLKPVTVDQPLHGQTFGTARFGRIANEAAERATETASRRGHACAAGV